MGLIHSLELFCSISVNQSFLISTFCSYIAFDGGLLAPAWHTSFSCQNLESKYDESQCYSTVWRHKSHYFYLYLLSRCSSAPWALGRLSIHLKRPNNGTSHRKSWIFVSLYLAMARSNFMQIHRVKHKIWCYMDSQNLPIPL